MPRCAFICNHNFNTFQFRFTFKESTDKMFRFLLPAYILCLTSFLFISCESAEEKQVRIDTEERLREHREMEERQRAKVREENAEKRRRRIQEENRIAAEEKQIAAEEKRREQAIWNEFSTNSLGTGTTPWSDCFGRKNSCNVGCSKIRVNGPSGSDVIVILKQNDVVKRHAYIASGGSYTFNIANGSWQPFFYYGLGWHPEREMTSPTCSSLKGGFLENDHWDKDYTESLTNQVLTYTLTTVVNGNFQTKDSNQNEAL